jgi:hypothetical protein
MGKTKSKRSWPILKLGIFPRVKQSEHEFYLSHPSRDDIEMHKALPPIPYTSSWNSA